jgi:hypothetical protein
LHTAENNAHQQQQNTHTPYHNQYEKSNFLKDVKSKDIDNVKKKIYKICVIERDEDVHEYFDEIK